MFKSLECNRWQDEEPYEQSDVFPAAQVTTLQASNLGSLRARAVGLDFSRLLEGIAASMQGTKATDI